MNYADNAAAIGRALEILHEREANLFLTGRAGTGKTTFLDRARKELADAGRNVAVVAFSGMAAVQAGGVTIHSFFKLGLQAYHPEGPELNQKVRANFHYTEDKRAVLVALDLLFVDEVSMVRADYIDAMDKILRHVRQVAKPFGGVQLCLIGDAFQLPPVVTSREERALLKDAYSQSYAFFAARAFDRAAWVAIELPEVMRQRGGTAFVEILNRIRIGEHTQADLDTLNQRIVPPFAQGFINDNDTPLLTATKARVEERNRAALLGLETPLFTFEAEISGTFPETNFPAPRLLELRVGALVMFVRNDAGALRRYVNGSLGIVREVGEQVISISTHSGLEVSVTRECWEQLEFVFDQQSKSLRRWEIGTFKQFPLRLAYAMTIHKSQGLTLDAARVDASSAFTTGQTYVALSRVRSFEGLMLEQTIRRKDVRVASDAILFQRWIDAQQQSPVLREAADHTRIGATTWPQQPTLVPRFPAPRLNVGEHGAVTVVPHHTDLGRQRTRRELEDEIEALRKQRDELLRVVRKVSRLLGEV